MKKDTMKEYLYIFGYESPAERASNFKHGTDYESSGMIRILASSEEEALNWGHKVSEQFVLSQFPGQQVSWIAEGFASWIETSPDEELKQKLSAIPIVKCGEMPDFKKV